MSEAEAAAQALEDISARPAIQAADDIAQAFEFAGDRIAKALEGAARSGEFSFNSLAETIARDLARLAISEFVTAPLQGLVGDIGGKLLGASAQSKPSVTVNMTVQSSGGSGGDNLSEGQIAARLAQAVALGQSRG